MYGERVSTAEFLDALELLIFRSVNAPSNCICKAMIIRSKSWTNRSAGAARKGLETRVILPSSECRPKINRMLRDVAVELVRS